MSTSNNPPVDQYPEFDPQKAAAEQAERRKRIEGSLAKRHRKEKAFKSTGFTAVLIGLFFVVLLFASILSRGLWACLRACINAASFILSSVERAVICSAIPCFVSISSAFMFSCKLVNNSFKLLLNGLLSLHYGIHAKEQVIANAGRYRLL